YPGREIRDPSTGQVTRIDADFNQLTPFDAPVAPPFSTRESTVAVVCSDPPACSTYKATSLPHTNITVPNLSGTAFANVVIGFESSFPDASNPISVGDQIQFTDRFNPSRSFKGVVIGFPPIVPDGTLVSAITVRVDAASVSGAGQTMSRVSISNLS